MSFKFEKIKTWQMAMDFGENVNTLSNKLPDREKYNLTSQVRRAADSIALNIAEGSIGQSDGELARFLGYSIRSLAEVITCLYKARKRSYLAENEFKQLYDEAYQLMNMLAGFRTRIKKD